MYTLQINLYTLLCIFINFIENVQKLYRALTKYGYPSFKLNFNEADWKKNYAK